MPGQGARLTDEAIAAAEAAEKLRALWDELEGTVALLDRDV
jgi:hypothetical protein